MRCEHPRLRTFTFSDGTAIRCCPQCMTFDEDRQQTLRAPKKNIVMVRVPHVGKRIDENMHDDALHLQSLDPYALKPTGQTAYENEET